jgi:hypothetical protein
LANLAIDERVGEVADVVDEVLRDEDLGTGPPSLAAWLAGARLVTGVPRRMPLAALKAASGRGSLLVTDPL